MVIEDFIQKKKEMYSAILNFLDTFDYIQDEFNSLISIFVN